MQTLFTAFDLLVNFLVSSGLNPVRLPCTWRTLKIDLHGNEYINSFKPSNVDVQRPSLYQSGLTSFRCSPYSPIVPEDEKNKKKKIEKFETTE